MPKDRKIQYIPEKNKFILLAKKIAKKSGCTKQATGSVLVKNGKIIGKGTNAGKRVRVCPRVLRGSKTGEDYHFCKDYCNQEGHSEVMAVRDAEKNGHNVAGSDLFLYGHWWCCKNCWDVMIKAGIKNVYLMKKSEEKFNFSSKIGKIYVSGALTFVDESLKEIYEKIAASCSAVCSDVYVPHLGGTDSVADPKVAPQTVWRKDHREVASSDLIIAYVGSPSLGVGAELEIARITASEIILWWFENEKVSRMALGNPAVSHRIVAKNEKDLINKLDLLFKKILRTKHNL